MSDQQTKTCERHGEYQSEACFIGQRFLGWSGCVNCDADAEAEEERQRAALAIEAKAKAFCRRVAAAGIYGRYQDASLDGWEETNSGRIAAALFAKFYVSSFAEILEHGRSATFVGNMGTGKSFLASAIAIELLRGNYSVHYTTVQQAIRRVKGTWGDLKTETEDDAIAAMTTPDLLILDEVGVQFGSDFERQLLFDILNKRYSTPLPTILISNIPASGLKKYLGERVTDRLNENGLGVVAFDWTSRR